VGHSRSKLTPAGRRLLVDRVVVEGWPVGHAARMAGVSRQTAHRWVTRFAAEGEAGLVDRSSRPLSCPRRVSAVTEAAIVADRIAERDGPHVMAGRLGVARSTIYAVLRRRGLSRLSTLDRTTGVPIRYVRDHPGELVHVDTKQLARVPDGGGHRVRGRSVAAKTRGGGYEYAHSMVDDHTRVAYTELLASQDAGACAGFMLRAAAWFAHFGYRIDAVMTDNAKAYTSQAFQTALDTIGARHVRTRPYRPQTNGKVERFHKTLADKWAYKQPYQTNAQRTAALAGFLDFYNRQRPHSGLCDQPPHTVLVNHLCGKDS